MSTNRSVPPDTRPPNTEAQESPAGLATCPYALVDCDVHPLMGEGMASLRPFLSTAGQRRLGLDGGRSTDHDRPPRGGVGPSQHPVRQLGRGAARRRDLPRRARPPGQTLPTPRASCSTATASIGRSSSAARSWAWVRSPTRTTRPSSRPPTTTGWRRPGCRRTRATAAPSPSVRATPSRRRPKSAGAPRISASSRSCFR